MVTSNQIKQKIKEVIKYLRDVCGCDVVERHDNHHVISFTPPNGMTGVITLSSTPRTFEGWVQHLKQHLRKEMLRVGFSDSETKDMKRAIRLITITDGVETSKFDNLLSYCFTRKSLSPYQINELCRDRMEGFSYNYLTEKYGVSKSTIYNILKENGLIGQES
jgi:hypothetical protein